MVLALHGESVKTKFGEFKGLHPRMAEELRLQIEKMQNDPNKLGSPHAIRTSVERLQQWLLRAGNLSARQNNKILRELEGANLIDNHIRPYFEIAYGLTSQNLHFQDDAHVPPAVHATFAIEAWAQIFRWWARRYPPLPTGGRTKEAASRDLERMAELSLDEIEKTREDEALALLDESGVLLLTGEPWTGKTTLAASLGRKLLDDGYHLIICHKNTVLSQNTLTEALRLTIPDGGSVDRLHTVRNLCGHINALISTRVPQGDQVAVILDDPMGHRRLLEDNAITALQPERWLRLINEGKALGRLRIIVTSPTRYWEDGSQRTRDRSLEDRHFLERAEKARMNLTVAGLTKSVLEDVTRRMAKGAAALWSDNETVIQLVAEHASEYSLSYFEIRSLIDRTRDHEGEDEALLDEIHHLTQTRRPLDDLNSASEGFKKIIATGLICEALNDLNDAYYKSSKPSLEDLLQKIYGYSSLEDYLERGDPRIDSWLRGARRVEAGSAIKRPLPRFAHTTQRDAAMLRIRQGGREIVRKALQKTCIDKSGVGGLLQSWEALFCLTALAEFLCEQDAQFVHDELFNKAGIDSVSLLTSIVHNWRAMKETPLKQKALSFLRRVVNEKKGIRVLITTLAMHWLDLDPDARDIFILSATISEDDRRVFRWDNYVVVTFVGAVASNFTLFRRARDEQRCQLTTEALSIFDEALRFMCSQPERGAKSFNEDGVLCKGGETHRFIDHLKRIEEMGRIQGGMSNQDGPYATLREMVASGNS